MPTAYAQIRTANAASADQEGEPEALPRTRRRLEGALARVGLHARASVQAGSRDWRRWLRTLRALTTAATGHRDPPASTSSCRSPAAADAAAAALEALAVLAPRAESATLVDNSREGAAVGAAAAPTGVRVLGARRLQGSYYARNAGAARRRRRRGSCSSTPTARRPRGSSSAYLDPAPASRDRNRRRRRTAAAPGASRAARYAASRGHIDERFHIEHGPLPGRRHGQPARPPRRLRRGRRLRGDRSAAAATSTSAGACSGPGGRSSTARSRAEHRPPAIPTRSRLLAAKARRHAAGRAWVNRRWPGALPRPPIARPLPARRRSSPPGGRCAGIGSAPRFKLIDMRLAAAALGRLLARRQRRSARRPRPAGARRRLSPASCRDPSR